jgi:hypothetical protein
MKHHFLLGLSGSLILTTLFLTGCGGNTESQAPMPSSPSSPSASASKGGVKQENFQFAKDNALGALAGWETMKVCSLENVISEEDGSQSPGEVANSFKVEKGKVYKFIGFATDVERARVPSEIKLVLSNGSMNFSRSVGTGLSRPDVASYFKEPSLTNAGYQFDAAFGLVPAGSYQIDVLDVKSHKLCPTHETLVVE